MKYSPLVFFSNRLKNVKTIFSLQTVLRQIDGWIWPLGLSLPLPDVNHKPLCYQKFIAQCSRKVKRLFFLKIDSQGL